MTYYADLTPYEYLPQWVAGVQTYPDGVEILNVGWLEPDHGFPAADGAPDPEFLANLITLAADHVSAGTRGVHGCRHPHLFEDNFQYGAVYGSRLLYLGSAEIRVVAADGRWLAAPTLVVHYVRDHGYRPPAEFVEAVTALRAAPGRR